MADKNIFKLEGKSQEQVKEAFLEFLKIDKTKPGGYASVGSNKVICKVAKEACGVNSVLEIKKAEDATEVSKLLTGRIDEELDYGKRHQMTSLRCHVRKYIEFLNFCEGQKGKPVYEFDKDPDKPFIGASQFKKIVSLLKAKKNIILEGVPGVGKTFLARKIAYQLIGFVKDENIEMVQFHQSYSYEDFVQGIRPSEEGGFERRNGIFSSFEEIRVTEGLLGRLRQHRLSGFYKLVLNICRLIWNSTLPCKDKDGRLEFLDFTEDDFRMDCIFERFLMNFCKQNCRDEYPEVHREYIDFQLSPFGMMFKEAGEALPMMETDVTLFNPNRQEKLILDAKFYREALVSKFGGREKVRRDHLSQILSYVMNQEDRSKPHTMNACGALVYPTVDEDFDFSYRYKETGHRIFVRTVNLGQPWRKIEERVKEIVKGEGRDEW